MSSSDEDDDGPQTPEREAFNISNDQYYQPQTNSGQSFKPTLGSIAEELSIPKYGSSTIQHSLPAYDLWPPFFPTYVGEERLRNFHRPKLRHYSTGPQARHYRRLKPFPIKNLTRSISRYQMKLRSKIIRAINNGLSRDEIVEQFLLIRHAKDLTAKKGDLFLFEYCEEFPPVLSQVGMAANIKTLIMPKAPVKLSAGKQTQRKIKLSPTKSSLTQANAVTPNPLITSSPNSRLPSDDAMDTSDDNEFVEDKYQAQQQKNKIMRGNCNIGFDETIKIKQNHPTSYKQQVYFKQLEPGETMQVIENNMYRAPIFEHEMPSCDFLVVRTRNSFYIRKVNTIFTVGQTMTIVPIPEPTEAAINKFRNELSGRFIHKLFMQSDVEPPTINIKDIEASFPDLKKKLRNRLRAGGCRTFRSHGDLLYATEGCRFGLESLLEHRAAFAPERFCLNMAMLAARQRLRELNYTESMINPPNDVEMETEVLAAPWNTSTAILRAWAGRHYLDFKGHLIDPSGSQREGFSCVPWVRSPLEVEQQKAMQQSKGLTDSQTAPNLKNPLTHQIIREKQSRLATFQNEARLISKIQATVLGSREELSSDEEEYDDCEAMDNENELDSSFDEQLRDLDKMIIDGRTIDELNFEKEEEERRQMLKDFNENNRNTHNGLKSQASPVKSNGLTQISAGSFKNKILKITRIYNSPEGEMERTEIVREPKIIALYMQQKGGFQQQSKHSLDNEAIKRGCSASDESNKRICSLFDSSNSGLNRSLIVQRSNESSQFGSAHRRASLSLGPSELCRAEGLVLTISKTVLNTREMRQRRRDYTNP